ncbi:PAS domain S-box protein [Geobacter sp. SVR]|uniref:PAS domain S-box protein n=1 Tax=Geobacter sp. SVR TaxID=2495594 RepID=UPI00143EFF68|nr:PAS domain S-box protein [Geobacter sp. SVR]BCS52246.1 hypothetical protein GSVR_05540 [Geobacter sp. SVR]GCF85093.1 hypothetical protein GSbR_16930 [Geobacter sp. SVR]
MEASTIKVLVFEDNPAHAAMIQEMLTESRKPAFTVRHVRYLAEGLGQLSSSAFDVILIDLGLPDSQGLATALAVRDRARLTPIVVMTALDNEEIALKALQLDIQDYLVKDEITGNLLKRSLGYAMQRKHDTEALRQSEQRFASFMLHLPAAAWIKDLQGRYVYANAEEDRIFSLPFSEYLGKRDEEFLPPATSRQLRANDEQVLADGESLQAIELLRQADGIEHHLIVSKFPIPGPDGRPAYVAGIALDITERKLAEEQLRKSQNELAKIFHGVPALILVSTLKEGRIVDINQTALQTLGYRRDEVIGRTVTEIRFGDTLPDRAVMLQMLQEQGSLQNYEIRFSGKGGQAFIGLLSADLIEFDGEPHILSLVKDITLAKQAQQQVELLNRQLAARAVELEEANRELEAFNYTAAHDLRKPLSTINGYCQIIRELCGDLLDEECSNYLQSAYDGTWRMSRLIDALLRFSQASRVEPRRERVDLSGLARAVADELRHAEPARRVRFLIAEGIEGVGDADLLRVVLANLIGNAWKYTGTREEAVIEFGVTQVGEDRPYFIRDNGPGFSMADAEKLFIPFQRVAGNEFAGHGIGLATVERIIRRHGGRIWAEGEPGKGATFYFTLRKYAALG